MWECLVVKTSHKIRKLPTYLSQFVNLVIYIRAIIFIPKETCSVWISAISHMFWTVTHFSVQCCQETSCLLAGISKTIVLFAQHLLHISQPVFHEKCSWMVSKYFTHINEQLELDCFTAETVQYTLCKVSNVHLTLKQEWTLAST
jgi:hypothetical protein